MMDSKTKHTAGPWAIEECRGDFEVYPVKGGPPKLGRWAEVATVSGNYEAEDAANARLIAAAPDLLEALKAAKEVVDVAEGMTSCRSDDDFIWSAQKLINAAIAKAEGRSTPLPADGRE